MRRVAMKVSVVLALTALTFVPMQNGAASVGEGTVQLGPPRCCV